MGFDFIVPYLEQVCTLNSWVSFLSLELHRFYSARELWRNSKDNISVTWHKGQPKMRLPQCGIPQVALWGKEAQPVMEMLLKFLPVFLEVNSFSLHSWIARVSYLVMSNFKRAGTWRRGQSSVWEISNNCHH